MASVFRQGCGSFFWATNLVVSGALAFSHLFFSIQWQVFSLNNKGLKFIELSHAAAIGIKRAQGMWVAGSAVLYRIGTKSDANFVTTLTAADLCVYSHSFGPVIVGFDTARLLRGPSACLFARARIGKGLGSFFIGKKRFDFGAM